MRKKSAFRGLGGLLFPSESLESFCPAKWTKKLGKLFLLDNVLLLPSLQLSTRKKNHWHHHHRPLESRVESRNWIDLWKFAHIEHSENILLFVCSILLIEVDCCIVFILTTPFLLEIAVLWAIFSDSFFRDFWHTNPIQTRRRKYSLS